MERRGAVLAYLMRFKQICNHPSLWLGDKEFEPSRSGKFQRLAELCEPIRERQEKALVFTQLRSMTGPLARHLADVFGRPGLMLHGGTPIKKRAELVARFQDDEEVAFMVLSLKAGGTGLNLTAANHVVHFDRWWNPAVENQATDRAYRIGQRRNVLVHKFVCMGTVEERIDRLIADKQRLVDLQIAQGRVDALVYGSRAYEVHVRVDTLPEARWSALREECAGQIDSLVDLLRGELSDGVMGIVTRPRTGLFPSPKEIHLGCSCPDGAVMCKHVAAALYGVGNRLDHAPEVLFSLRGVDPSTLIEEAIGRGVAPRSEARGRTLEVDNLSAVFGVAIDFDGDSLASPGPPTRGDAGAPGRPELPARARQVLELIAECPDLRTPELARRLGISRSTVSKAIARLRAEELVVFLRAPSKGGYRCTEGP